MEPGHVRERCFGTRCDSWLRVKVRCQVREESRMSPGFLSHTPGRVMGHFPCRGRLTEAKGCSVGAGYPGQENQEAPLELQPRDAFGRSERRRGEGGGSLEPREEAEVEAAATSGARSPRESVREGKRGPGPTGVPTVLEPTKTKPGASGWLSG